MSQNLVDDVLVLDTWNDSRRSAAPTANLDIDVEYAFKPVRLGHSSMALGRCLYFRICAHLRFLAMIGGVISPRQQWFGASTPWY